jgi:glutaminyl-tRNA synthetase
VKLQLDDETGEKVSKNELKRRLQKRAKKAAAALTNSKSVLGSRPKPVVDGPEPAVEPVDHDAMFSRGLLAEIYRLRPSAHVVTRFPPEPEPNGYLHV